MATLRFGTPAANDAEQVVLGARWGGTTLPQAGLWRDTFIYGIGTTASALNATFRTIGGGTETYQLNTTARRLTALTHPDSGIRTNGFNCVAYWNASSALTGWATDIETTAQPLVVVQGIVNDVDNEWLALSDGAAAAANIDTVLTAPLSPYAAHPSVIAYCLADDLPNDAVHGRRAEELMARIPQLDGAARPATPSFLGNTARLEVDAGVWQIGLFGGGGYPCRWTSTGVKRAEGDFTHADDGGGDWQEWTRGMIMALPATANVWWWLQAHQLGDGSVPTLHLSYPTAREIRKQVWESVGSGARGLLWFVYEDEPAGPWEGLAHPNSAARIGAVAEMARRLSPGIRRRLMTARPTATNTEFTASGGGSSGWQYKNYANAYISTLYDSAADLYYVVVCNRSTSAAAVTINAATLTGMLVNLEDGTQLVPGNAVTLAPLDGTIYRLAPDTVQFVVTLINDTEVTF